MDKEGGFVNIPRRYESTKKVTALTGKVFSDTESCDEEMAYDDLDTSYKDL